MGHFDGEKWVTGDADPLAAMAVGSPAGVRERQREPLRNRNLREAAKLLMPAGAPREAKPSSFDAGTAEDRRNLGRAATFVAGLDGGQAEKLSGWLAAEQAQLTETAGPAEDGRQEHDEKVFLINDLADDVEAQAAERAEAQLAFYEAAMEAFGGREELFAWVDRQDDPQEALVWLAEEYLEGAQPPGDEPIEFDE